LTLATVLLVLPCDHQHYTVSEIASDFYELIINYSTLCGNVSFMLTSIGFCGTVCRHTAALIICSNHLTNSPCHWCA